LKFRPPRWRGVAFFMRSFEPEGLEVDLVGMVFSEAGACGFDEEGEEVVGFQEGLEAGVGAETFDDFEGDGVGGDGVPAEEEGLLGRDGVVVFEDVGSDGDLDGVDEVEADFVADDGEAVDVDDIGGAGVSVEACGMSEEAVGGVSEADADAGDGVGAEEWDVDEGGDVVEGGGELVFAGAEVDLVGPSEVWFSGFGQERIGGRGAEEEELVGLEAVLEEDSEDLFAEDAVGGQEVFEGVVEFEADDVVGLEEGLEGLGQDGALGQFAESGDQGLSESPSADAVALDELLGLSVADDVDGRLAGGHGGGEGGRSGGGLSEEASPRVCGGEGGCGGDVF